MVRQAFKLLVLSLCSVLTCSCSVVGSSNTATSNFLPSSDVSNSEEIFNSKEEDVIGRAVAARILVAFRPLSDNTIQQYVNDVGAVVVASSPRPTTFAGYSFLVLETDEVNAMAAPGGYIFITRGLLKLLGSEEDLAAVLAHEVTHVVEKHGLQAIKPEHSKNYLEVGGQVLSAIDCTGLSQQTLLAFQGAVDDVFQTLLNRGYSREQEYAADRGAVRTLTAAGYNAHAFDSIFTKLAQLDLKAGWFATHPTPQDRGAALSATLQQLGPNSDGQLLRTARFLKAVGGN